ncbi:serine hydrolase [Paenalcaligenes niemegkensis]|nr:serine hydrolase [Paenalcaligenes niemegkensis]MCQ9617853.1 serine hydrolase [Paenalcaligenes niemegkensis]
MGGPKISLDALCAATLRTSDNTAANKVLEALGGPGAVTAFLRTIDDKTTRLDRWETELNEATPGDLRDTTTPAAMASSSQELLLGDALSPSARETLIKWLINNEVGGPLLRAGLPDDWRIGDRTGAGAMVHEESLQSSGPRNEPRSLPQFTSHRPRHRWSSAMRQSPLSAKRWPKRCWPHHDRHASEDPWLASC